jgi:hypothetical protein
MSRNTHHRTDDHHGIDLDTSIETASLIDRYVAGTSLHDLLASLTARVAAMEQYLGIYSFELSAVVLRGQTGSFAAAAMRCAANGSFPGWEGSFSADAIIV